jgi:transposase
MVKLEEFMNIFLLRDKGFSISAIHRETGMDRKTIRKYLKMGRNQRPVMKPRKTRRSKLTPFTPRIHSLLHLNEGEYIPATVIYEKLVEQGFSGSLSLVQKYIQHYKKIHLPKVVVRFETGPGEQAQVDWGEKKIRDPHSGITRKVYIFCMTLCWSRMRFVHFFPRADMYHFLLGHQLAFDYFGGIPREILYDQNRCVLLRPGSKAVEFNRKMVDFAHHYGFLPRVCKPYRAQTKGKVENLVKYVKRNFLSTQTTYHLEPLNQRKREWLNRINQKVHSTTGEIPFKRWTAEGLPPVPEMGHYDLYYLETRKVFTDSTFSYKRRRYSVPPDYIGKFISIKFRPENKRMAVFYNDRLITQHRTDQGGEGQYVIKRVHRHRIWKFWCDQNHPLDKNGRKATSQNHVLSLYEELALSDQNAARFPISGLEVSR